MLFNCILICYGAYFNYPVLVLVYNIIWFYCDLTHIIMKIARRTGSVNKGVLSAAVNCTHRRLVNLTLLALLTLRYLQLKFYFYYAACL